MSNRLRLFQVVQRVYPETHYSSNGKSKGSQWVLSDATLAFARIQRFAKGADE